MNTENLTTVTYTMSNGAKIVQPITKQAIEAGKKGNRTEQEMHELFRDTAWDKNAVGYSLEGMEDSAPAEREIHFSKNAKKEAKRDYRDIKRENPNGAANQLKQFRAMVADKFANNQRSLRFNLSKLHLN
ncbi:MAG TPA: hypothetical protein VF680_16995 [Allosphingosinicella sp.]|jgi:hypothetical protein